MKYSFLKVLNVSNSSSSHKNIKVNKKLVADHISKLILSSGQEIAIDKVDKRIIDYLFANSLISFSKFGWEEKAEKPDFPYKKIRFDKKLNKWIVFVNDIIVTEKGEKYLNPWILRYFKVLFPSFLALLNFCGFVLSTTLLIIKMK